MASQLSIWQEQENPLVRMHNHLVTASFGNLELNSMRIFLIMLAKLNDATDLTPIRINLHDIDPNCFGKKNYELIQKAIGEIRSNMKEVKLNYMKGGNRVTEEMSVIDSIIYEERSDFMEANFGIRVRKYLLDLKGNFTQAELRELLKLKSTYSIRFYLLIKSLYRVGQVYTSSVPDLKMMLIGSTEVYADYRNFKKWVIRPAQKALEKTSSAFNFEEHKTGKSITSISFWPLEYPTTLEIKQVLSDSVAQRLKEHKVNLNRILEMLASNEITEAYIIYVIDAKLKDKKVKKPGGAIFDAIVNKHLWDDYQKWINKPVKISPKLATTNFRTITLQEAEKMYEQEKADGKTRYPFSGFVKAIKTGRCIIVEGYIY